MPGGHFLEKSVHLGTPRVRCTTHIVEIGGVTWGRGWCRRTFARTRLEWSEGVDMKNALEGTRRCAHKCLHSIAGFILRATYPWRGASRSLSEGG